MSTHTSPPRRDWRTATARLLNEALAPSVIVLVLPLTVAWQATGAVLPTVLWSSVVALTSSVLPMGVVVWGSRTGRWDGHHVRDRRGRLIPFITLIVLSMLGLAILISAEAPWPLIALDIGMIVSLFLTGAITIFWKVSIHSAVAAGATVVLALTYGALWWLLAVVVAAVSWARVAVEDHTPAQVVGGALTGALVGSGCFAMLVGNATPIPW
ncbi:MULTISPECIES: phosphatase PAP2 family protein [Actinopolyspora]|uniref:PAP2 superfamily protein n=1 Tax=Actinopolyspora saharensis TaxID=995062 RepID=A0A1H1F141_9ACTN|nr:MULTISPECIES: phosphatase PAP2 family protein [Actinopolyspora]NHD18317.1 phosphatase PAP2 family protein [Actinopolyspora sp. BKK2]NHE77004.1 phosphatase PAP2 family protein [Actinopolyspora sp. BKK1]SDQ94683.1 PAP2 superfamily protein [Actinopolyspora saharensis]